MHLLRRLALRRTGLPNWLRTLGQSVGRVWAFSMRGRALLPGMSEVAPSCHMPEPFGLGIVPDFVEQQPFFHLRSQARLNGASFALPKLFLFVVRSSEMGFPPRGVALLQLQIARSMGLLAWESGELSGMPTVLHAACRASPCGSGRPFFVVAELRFC